MNLERGKTICAHILLYLYYFYYHFSHIRSTRGRNLSVADNILRSQPSASYKHTTHISTLHIQQCGDCQAKSVWCQPPEHAVRHHCQIRLVLIAPSYLPHTALQRCRGATKVPVGTTNTQIEQRCTWRRVQATKAEGFAWLTMSMFGSSCSGKIAAASRRAGLVLTYDLQRHPEALTPVTHAISGRTSRELLQNHRGWRGRDG